MGLGPWLFGACSSSEEADEGEDCKVDTSYAPTIDPANFVAGVDNPLFPLVPGTTYIYEAGPETVETTVTNETKVILGVTSVVVRDTAKLNGEVIEDTFDWYAQDKDGAVWYMGEDTKELDSGKVVSTEGSWEAGVDGAKPGYIIPPNIQVGQSWRQEYYACEAEDEAEALDLNASETVPFGSYTGCLKTHDYTGLDSSLNENKVYCPGVGLVVAIDMNSGEREELKSKTP